VHDESVYLGLGSNMGNRTANLRTALAGLREHGLRLRAVSSFYLTEPDLRSGEADDVAVAVDAVGHPWYVNCVAAIDAAPEPRAVLEICHQLEEEQGRKRDPAASGANGPRPRSLDIDLLLVGDRVINEPGLKVPHPRMAQRRFVLQPLAEIAPDIRHPVAGVSISSLLAALPQRERVSLLEPPPGEVP
jgi:2-amino-4-hydroxy-6-hydroxymethyldihydropteridine diphosphokinase